MNPTTPRKIIAVSPPPAQPGMEWECQCQCGRCGSSMDWTDCDQCEDGYSYHDCGEDTCCCRDKSPNVICDMCEGRGGWRTCLSGAEWCEAHPMPGREGVKRGEIEWFEVEMERA